MLNYLNAVVISHFKILKRISWLFLNLKLNISNTKVNDKAGKGHHCRTPVCIIHGFEIHPLFFIVNIGLLYNVFIISINFGPKLYLCSPLKKGGILFCTCLLVGLESKRCPLNMSWPLCWKVAKRGTVNDSREEMFPNDFQVTWSKVKIKLLFFVQMSSAFLF